MSRAASDVSIRPFDPADEHAVIGLWDEAGLLRPWNDPHADIARKLAEQPELFFVAARPDGEIVGAVMAGYDGHRGWLNYLATSTAARGTGAGRALVEHAEAELLRRGCPKINLQIRAGNDAVAGFYRHLGYTVDETIDMGKRLIIDEPPAAT
ncbi:MULTISPECIES: GNAT family acetyltransferase [unclassified Microcella]|uniref:GNAT family acetyltransferase n=1 Tax=unclassified Microcella TaxID=2630066 RepID=UPI0006F703E3|nr:MULTISPECIES: GNAT family acetyltransferase [unclassified Microcella]KQV26428.1 hypothetical protein ASC54_05985 [Yonghaparkia sp. Root332]KRF32786.1 hypothetical protein ASG83_01725 [Yonghaparkia sp. Soil809]